MNGWLWYLLSLFVLAMLAAVANPKTAPAVKVLSVVMNGSAIVAVMGAAGVFR